MSGFAASFQSELKRLLTTGQYKNILLVLNETENPLNFLEALPTAEQIFVFTESSETYKKLDGKTVNHSGKTNLNCAHFNNAELKEDLFDAAIFVKFFNRLNKEEKEKTLKNLSASLKTNGHVFLYENDWTQSDGKIFNPSDLIHEFNSIRIGEKNKVGFEFIFARPLRTFVEFNDDSFQICFSFKKIDKTNDHTTLQDFLDQQQYSRNGVLRYERIFGAGFVSTGGVDTTREFLGKLNIKKDHSVLDVGCGIGGGDIFMAENYGCSVIGVDLSANMVSIAYERLFAIKEKKLKVSFEIGDVMHHNFEPNSFDLIYSRDTILHISDKAGLFARLYNWLKPGGQIFISDYTCAPKETWSKNYQEYVAQRRYTLLTVPEYGKVLESVGFVDVNAQDVTDKFVECLKTELVRIEEIKDEFIREFSEEDYHHLVEGWHSKLERCAQGDQRWGTFYGRK